MIRKKSLLKGTALSVLPGLLSIVLSIISIPIFLSRVGPEVYGGYIIFHIILSLSSGSLIIIFKSILGI